MADGERANSSGKAYQIINYKPAIILYPSLLTPEILVGNDYIELLIIGKKDNPLTEKDINWQLKISEGLDQKKAYYPEPLFKENEHNYIKMLIEDIDSIKGRTIGTGNKFFGIIDKRAFKDFFEKEGYNQIYKVNITKTHIKKEGIYNIFWLSFNALLPIALSTLEKAKKEEQYALNLEIKTKTGEIIIPGELQDSLIVNVLKDMNGNKIMEGGKYCFKHIGNDINIAEIELDNPIQSYHPIFYYGENKYFNLAHISDLHICARQQVLRKTKARVIEYGVEDKNGKFVESDKDVSPEIGDKITVCSRNVKKVLDVIGADKEIDILLITGDIIDYIKSLNIQKNDKIRDSKSRRIRNDLKINDIWKTVALDGKYEERYQDFVDYISFYSLIIGFLKTYQKPVFLVSGNHDCYHKPYGILPRVKIGPVTVAERPNAGIPADHNLTIYEAILSFGKTYNELKQRSMFSPSKFKWFYSILTPFSDFAIQLPYQNLVGFAWGDEEDLIDVPYTNHGMGHLPRSEEAISDNQLKILEYALRNNKKVILMSHFTFVSYRDKIPLDKKVEGNVQFDSFWNASDYDYGTFEKNRKALFEKYIYKERKVQCILTGHSHRRGLYTITGINYSGNNSVKTKFYDFQQLKEIKGDERKTFIIVSDSLGSIPRHNEYEYYFLKGWGSDLVSGTSVIYNKYSGEIESIRALRIGNKPRFIVSLDYMDIVAKKDVITRFRTGEIIIREEKMGILPAYTFDFWLDTKIYQMGVYVKKVLMYHKLSKKGWYRVELQYDNTINQWRMEGKDMEIFYNYMSQPHWQQQNFMSIKFETSNRELLKQYNFDDYWNFPFEVGIEYTVGGHFPSIVRKIYLIKRNKKRSEKPDFNWRMKIDKYR